MNFVDLLENYLILKERDKDLYYDVKDNIDKYKSFIYDNLAYDIIIKDDFIKLGQAMKLAGIVGSGVDAKFLIQDGQVKVNGEVDTRRGKKLYPGDTFEFEGTVVLVK